jgi:hypothetical protein
MILICVIEVASIHICLRAHLINAFIPCPGVEDNSDSKTGIDNLLLEVLETLLPVGGERSTNSVIATNNEALKFVQARLVKGERFEQTFLIWLGPVNAPGGLTADQGLLDFKQ